MFIMSFKLFSVNKKSLRTSGFKYANHRAETALPETALPGTWKMCRAVFAVIIQDYYSG